MNYLKTIYNSIKRLYNLYLQLKIEEEKNRIAKIKYDKFKKELEDAEENYILSYYDDYENYQNDLNLD